MFFITYILFTTIDDFCYFYFFFLLLITYEKTYTKIQTQSVALVLHVHICIKQTFSVIYFVRRPTDLFYCNGLCRFRSVPLSTEQLIFFQNAHKEE